MNANVVWCITMTAYLKECLYAKNHLKVFCREEICLLSLFTKIILQRYWYVYFRDKEFNAKDQKISKEIKWFCNKWVFF